MIVVELDGIEVDHCVACHGTWFDAGELELLLLRSGAREGQFQAALRIARPVSGQRRACPRCRRRLLRVELGNAEPIRIDLCRVRQGLWLDLSELAALVRAYEAGPDAAIAAFCRNLVGHHLAQEK